MIQPPSMRLLANTLQIGDILRKYFSRKLIASNKMWATALYVGQQRGLCNYRTITHVLLLKCHSLLTRRYVYLLFHGCIGMLKMLTVLILFTFFKPTREALVNQFDVTYQQGHVCDTLTEDCRLLRNDEAENFLTFNDPAPSCPCPCPGGRDACGLRIIVNGFTFNPFQVWVNRMIGT